MTKALQVVRAKNDLLIFLLCWNNNPNVKPVNQFFFLTLLFTIQMWIIYYIISHFNEYINHSYD